TQSNSRGKELKSSLHGDITRREDLRSLPREFDWVVNCVASGGGTVEDYRRTYLLGTRNLLDWLQAAPRKYVYTSSTGVYGQDDGSLVTESDPAMPAAETAKILVETENVLLKAAAGKNFPAVVLRLAGIYGPERGYWLRQFLCGEARFEGDGGRFLNMIHRDDVVGAVIAALQKASGGSVVNVVDNEPATQLAVFSWLAQRLGKPMPPVASEAGTILRRRSATNKRVSNLKLRAELGYRLLFPTFREGYEAELARLAEL
ncbi:MAG: NAD-dependent epimerase/dehydratase family protein, partial [Akkermansiaceae bacterium]|nr:NAD-dependent epimerase/dehydratase family protein [Verrucomicrobiales bacterium]